jgi:hypothetical protein
MLGSAATIATPIASATAAPAVAKPHRYVSFADDVTVVDARADVTDYDFDDEANVTLDGAVLRPGPSAHPADADVRVVSPPQPLSQSQSPAGSCDIATTAPVTGVHDTIYDMTFDEPSGLETPLAASITPTPATRATETRRIATWDEVSQQLPPSTFAGSALGPAGSARTASHSPVALADHAIQPADFSISASFDPDAGDDDADDAADLSLYQARFDPDRYARIEAEVAAREAALARAEAKVRDGASLADAYSNFA